MVGLLEPTITKKSVDRRLHTVDSEAELADKTSPWSGVSCPWFAFRRPDRRSESWY